VDKFGIAGRLSTDGDFAPANPACGIRLLVMQIRLSIRDVDGFARDVAVTAPSDAVVDEVFAAIKALLPRGRDGEAGMWSGSHRLPSNALLGGPGLRNGDVLTLGRAGERDLIANAVLRLHVTGGPDAGLIEPLPRGVTTVGRSPTCDVTLTDPDVSRQHAALTVTTAGITVRDLGSTNGTLLDGAAVDPDGAFVALGQVLRLGESLLCVAAADEPAAAVRPGPDGVCLVNRPPRLAGQLPDREVVAPVRSTSPGPQRIQWLAALLPTLVGVGLALAMHSIQFLAFTLLSPVMIIGTSAGDRLHWRRSRRREANTFHRRDATSNHECARLLTAEVAHRRRAHPDPAAVLRTATIPDSRLWERRRSDPDVLDVRLGVADLPAALRLRRGTECESAGIAHLVPSVVNLCGGPIGIAGPRGIALGTGRWIVTQLAALHSPSDLRLVLLLSDAAAPAWTWARWLPHLHDNVATDVEHRAAIVADLARVVDERLAHRPREPGGWTGPWTVVLVDRAGALADLPGLAGVLANGPSVGITAVCLDDEERRLPAACRVVARVCGETGTRLDVQTAAGTANVLNDRVGTRWAERVARALAPLADASVDSASAILDQYRLLDLLDIGDAAPEAIISRWSVGQQPRTVLGCSAEGPFGIDLERDGPHALVAGTTGAGKSELLQSLIAGVAAGSSPEAVAFLLIDYKGGAAFAECGRLPHSVGLVTDLDPHLTRRALQSLDAELRRREALFADAGVKDIAGYRASPHHQTAPVGRLVLVVDEFAALAEELPDFVSGLVAIAQRGRSLGVHLVLATQRPGGVISPEIRANSSLRIALRVTDAAESMDVIGTDAAAAIDKKRPGRAFVRTGSSVTEIQVGRVAGAVPIAGRRATVTPLDEWGRASPHDRKAAGDKTDLQLLVDAICEAAARCDLPAPQRPWLPPLPTELPARRLREPSRHTTIPVGLIDLPSEQRQSPLCIDLRTAGPILLVGGPRSGRTTALRTFAGSAAARLSPGDLHIYAIDGAGGQLRALGDLPHCGAVIARDEFGAAERLLAKLTEEVAHRHARLTEVGASSLAEARDGGEAIPYLALLIDSWEGFVAASDEHDAGRSVDTLLNLLRESAAVGVTVALTGDRAALAARVAGAVARKYVFRLADRADYALAGIPPGAVPGSLPSGRALCAETGAEVQFAFLGADASTAEQQRALSGVATSAPPPAEGREPFRIRPLPSRIAVATVVREAAASDSAALPSTHVLLGVGGDEPSPIAVDLFAGDARLLIAGPPRSGRTTALRLILDQVCAAGHAAALRVAAPRRSALLTAATARGLNVVTPDDPPSIVDPPSQNPLLLLVDDSEAFLDSPVGEALSGLVRRAAHGVAAAVAAHADELAVTYRGIAHEVRRSRAGLLLQPGPGDGDLLGLRLGRARPARLPGRGVLAVDQPQLRQLSGGASVIPIQVALP
jgi:S-DNA-T family DNA segregation ATPase FtsK/SpoIIIE